MYKRILSAKINSNIQRNAAALTLFFMGMYLQFNPSLILSTDITQIMSTILFSFSCLFMMKTGEELEKKNIAGVSEIALGVLQVYVCTRYFPRDGYWSFLFLFSVGFFLFASINGSIAFIYSMLQVKTKNLLSKTESIVAILTSLITIVFTGVELLVQ